MRVDSRMNGDADASLPASTRSMSSAFEPPTPEARHVTGAERGFRKIAGGASDTPPFAPS